MWRVLALALVLGGCGGSGIHQELGDVHAVPPELFFQAYVDAPSGMSCGQIQTFQLINSSRSATDVILTLSGDGVFQLRRPKEHLLGGSNPIDVQCSGGGTGNFDATLTFKVMATSQTGSIQLHCNIADAPACTSDDPCAPAKLDATCACIHSVIPEDGACSTNDTCIVNERCVHGQCVGQPKNCDDQNVCTRDSCIPGAGCVHPDVSDDCPVPQNPCMAGICDPHDGCKEVPADGKSCGERSCRLAQICDSGECKDRTPRDGDPCVGDCGDGTCQTQVCVETNGPQLADEPVLEVSRPDVEVPGLVDSSGHVILVNPNRPSLLAYGQAGGTSNTVIWESPLPNGGANPAVLSWNGWLVVSTGTAISWVKPQTGGLPSPAVALTRFDPNASAIPSRGIVVRTGNDSVTTAYNVDDTNARLCRDGSRENHIHLMAFSERGVMMWGDATIVAGDLRRDPLSSNGMVADENGNLLFTAGGCDGPDRLIMMTTDGTVAFDHPLSDCTGCEVMAAYHGTVYLAGDLLVHYDAVHVTSESVLPAGGQSPLLADPLALAFDADTSGPRMRIIDSTGARDPQEVALDDAGSTGAAFLTKAGTLMVLETRLELNGTDPPTSSAWIAELAPDGQQLRACRIGDGEAVGPPTGGDAGTLLEATTFKDDSSTQVLRIRRYHLPKFDFAPGGWRAYAGGNDRAWAP